jgi:hypothetical protein
MYIYIKALKDSYFCFDSSRLIITTRMWTIFLQLFIIFIFHKAITLYSLLLPANIWEGILQLTFKSFNPIEHMFRPSMRISPLEGSTKRNKALISVLFPLPVLPTTPTLLPSLNVQVIPLRTNGALGRYLIWRKCKKEPSE